MITLAANPLIDAASIALAVVAVLGGVAWSIAIGHMLASIARVPTLRDGVDLIEPGAPARVLVVVPAHNEERVIGRMLESLRRQESVELTVVLGLDRCTDRTAEIAQSVVGDDPRFSIVEISECPEGWAGKVHAIHAAMRSASDVDAEYVLFTDADTTFDDRCIAASVALACARGLGLLSVLSTLSSRTWFERVAQPAAGLELLRQYPLLKVNREIGAPHHRAFANGQYMLFTTEAYHAAGAHESVKDELLEDIALARRVRDAGFRGGLVLGAGVLRCEMYPDWAAFRRGWKRIYTESANRRADRLAKSAFRLAAIGTGAPVIALLSLLFGAAGFSMPELAGVGAAGWAVGGGVFGLLSYAIAWSIAARMARAHPLSVPAAPIGAWLVSRVLSEAARDLRERRPTEWGGMSYAREERGG